MDLLDYIMIAWFVLMTCLVLGLFYKYVWKGEEMPFRLAIFLTGLYTTMILAGGSGLWDMCVVKAGWSFYPTPFDLVRLPRFYAGDIFASFVCYGTLISWVTTIYRKRG